MEKQIKFRHNPTSFPKRIKYFGTVFTFIICLFLLPYFINEYEDLPILPMILTILIFLIPFILLIWRSKLYLADFYCDSNSVRLKYYNRKKEHEIIQPLSQINVYLKNTPSRFGFNCELIIKVENNKFFVDDTFEWSLIEIKMLFEYIKHFKNETLSEKDKFNIQRIEDKWKNR